MGAKEKLIKNLKSHRRNEIYFRSVELILSLLFVFLTPAAIYDIIIEGDSLTIIILCITEIIFLGISFFLTKIILDLKNITNSRIYQCIENPLAMNEIIIRSKKIIFEIKGMQDETLYLSQSKFRNELIENVINVFGSDKIVREN
jgi:hypothetical protein